MLRLPVLFHDPHAAAVRIRRPLGRRVGVALDFGQDVLNGGVGLEGLAGLSINYGAGSQPPQTLSADSQAGGVEILKSVRPR